MIDPKTIPTDNENLNSCEIEHLFHPCPYQPAGPPLRVVTAMDIRYTTDDGRERIDFSSCFADHKIGHQDPRVNGTLCDQARKLRSCAPKVLSGAKPKLEVGKKLAEMGRMAMSENQTMLSVFHSR